jgi:hypothetical protein
LVQKIGLVICGYGMFSADQRACNTILKSPSKEVAVEIVCGSQGQRIAEDFRNAGFRTVSFDTIGRFEQWVERL